MNPGTRAWMLVLSITAPALLGATVVLFAQRSSSGASVPVCIKSNGQVRVLTAPAATCDSSEQRTDWVVGGELTNIAVGQGLIGSRQDGTFQLAIDPSVLQACTGCRGGRIFSGFNDGPVALPTVFDAEIARLDLPAGNFSIFVKMTITNTRDAGFDDRAVCTLKAGADFDEADLVLSEDVNPVVEHPYNAAAGLTLQLVHHFSAPGSATLYCSEGDCETDLSYRDLKIIAIEGSSISNVFLGTD